MSRAFDYEKTKNLYTMSLLLITKYVAKRMKCFSNYVTKGSLQKKKTVKRVTLSLLGLEPTYPT